MHADLMGAKEKFCHHWARAHVFRHLDQDAEREVIVDNGLSDVEDHI
jgi:hypothetical protein